MDPISPIIHPSLVEHERVIALDQPEYLPLVILAFDTPETPTFTRWRLTAEERALVAQGGELVLCQLLCGRDFTPVALEIVAPGAVPSKIMTWDEDAFEQAGGEDGDGEAGKCDNPGEGHADA